MNKSVIFFLILSSFSYGSTLSKAKKAYASKKYFTASSYVKQAIGTGSSGKSIASLISKIIPHTGIYSFLDLPIEELNSVSGNSAVNYLKGKKQFFLKKDDLAIKYFKKVKSNSRFYLQAILNLASLYEIKGKFSKSLSLAKKCVGLARSGVKVNPSARSVSSSLRAYIHDTCEILIPRTYYKMGKLKKSRAYFKKIDSRSFQFPHLLFDSSWAYFRTKDYNRAVGRNLTFQVPLLDNYFLPETELVKALTYLELCDYDETINVIESYDKKIRKKLNSFTKKFNLDNKESFPFAKFIKDRSRKKKLKNNFISKMFDVVAMKPGMKVLDYHYKRLRSEEKKVKFSEKSAFEDAKDDFIKFYNSYVKVKFVKYSKEVIRVSNIMAEMELDIYTHLKNQLYYIKKRKKKELKKEEPFDIRNAFKRRSNQHFYNFKGEFWADELGNYIPVLQSHCKRKKRK